MTVEEMNNEMVPILEAWHNLQNQIAGLLAGKPVRCFDETMLAMDNAVRRLNAGEPPKVTFSQGGTPAAHGASWERDAGDPGPRCPKCGCTHLQARQSAIYVCYVECPDCEWDFAINDISDFAQFFPAERQEGWVSVKERLPGKNPLNPANSVHVLMFRGLHKGRPIYEVGVLWYAEYEALGITHWRPLPAPPSAPKGKEKA